MCHHDYTTATGDPQRAAVVYLANRLSHRYGFGCAAGGDDPSGDPVCSFLGLERGWLVAIDERAPGLYAIARRMLE